MRVWSWADSLCKAAVTLCIIWVLLVLLMVAASGRSNSPQPANTPISTSPLVPAPTNTPTTKLPSTPKSAASPTVAPTLVEPAAREALENALKDPMAQIGDRVPGFGGVFLDSTQNIVYIYLQDAQMQERAESVLTEVFGPDLLAGREVRVLEGKYSMTHLDAWYRTLRRVIRQVPVIAWTGLDESINRIEIGMLPRRGGREEMEAAIATVDVPREAIVIEVGCDDLRLSHYLGERPNEAFLRTIDHSLEVVPEASYGETVRMKLTVRNVSDEPEQLVTPPHELEVLR